MRRIKEIQIPVFYSSLFNTCAYFGGDRVTYLPLDATKEERGEFETFVTRGHVPEFVEFWNNQLQNI